MTRKIFKALLFSVTLLSFQNSNAQDSRYSQYYTAPLSYNPANVGLFNGTFRIAGFFRNQFSGFGTPVRNAAFSFDLPVGKFGLGLNTQAYTAGAFQNINANFNIGFRIRLGKKSFNYIGIGVQGGLVQKSINTSDLTFGQGPDNVASSSALNPDAGAGIVVYNTDIKRAVKPFVGASASHLIPSKKAFISENETTVLQRRLLGYAGIQCNLNKKFDIVPQAIYTMQGNVQDISAGFITHYFLRDADFSLLLGGAYRLNDAFTGLAGFQVKDLFIGIAYDYNVSPLAKAANGGANAIEASLIYVKKRKPKYVEDNLCPRL